MVNDQSNRAPYAPSRGIIVPIVSIIISLPTLAIGLLLVFSGTFLALTGRSLYTGGSQVIQVSVFDCLFLVMGPIVALVLCTTQRTRAEQVYGSALLLGFKIKRWNRIALWCAGLALAMIPLMAVVSAVLVSLYPQ